MSINAGTSLVRNGLLLHLNSSASENYTLSEVEVLVVAGGGSGGPDVGGGGGAGGLIYNSAYPVTPGNAISVVVGNGGAARVPFVAQSGENGQNSIFGVLTAVGGGGGGNYNNGSGTSGGSGGGGSGGSSGGLGGASILGQGFPGGNGFGGNFGSGGGGGAGGPGQKPSTIVGGNGGPGLPFSISGTLTYYAGGGGGGGGNDSSSDGRGFGGIGGGGTGASRSGTFSTNESFRDGRPNTGGGGGGTGGWNTSGAGGSGIVIVRYPGTQKATGGTITSVNGYTIHTFTTSGTFTPQSSQTFYGVTDLGPNRRDFQIIGSPTYSSTVPENFTFNGNGQAWTLQNLTAAAPELTSENFLSKDNTVETWVNFSTTSPTGEDATESSQGLIVWPGYHTGMVQQPSNIRFYVWNDGVTSLYTHSYAVTFNTDVWYQIIHTFDYGANQAKWYINGSLVDTLNTVPTSFQKSINHENRLNIGLARPVSTPNSYRWRLNNGKISSVRLYNRALSETEIQQNFNQLRGRFGI